MTAPQPYVDEDHYGGHVISNNVSHISLHMMGCFRRSVTLFSRIISYPREESRKNINEVGEGSLLQKEAY